ncbi:putative choline dehydrogenase protein [Botrytis fragariae]|uniref:Putative choline dehydrogenase protein n=1 Tax=Botrytis fragariae TaxID=1964551 RepID=A0A8H6ENT6_9HELO|nr:putative choline dehydrogenase protein [Botrytis fragariae]KAF5879032.1 putative choline dehydrogenase protein [Botrytis fragariae]
MLFGKSISDASIRVGITIRNNEAWTCESVLTNKEVNPIGGTINFPKLTSSSLANLRYVD